MQVQFALADLSASAVGLQSQVGSVLSNQAAVWAIYTEGSCAIYGHQACYRLAVDTWLCLYMSLVLIEVVNQEGCEHLLQGLMWSWLLTSPQGIVSMQH